MEKIINEGFAKIGSGITARKKNDLYTLIDEKGEEIFYTNDSQIFLSVVFNKYEQIKRGR